MLRTLPLGSLVLVASVVVSPPPAQAQSQDRIWGRVTTTDGETHTGFVRFRGVATWSDFLVAEKNIPDESYQDWLDATRDGMPHVRVVEFKGHRISWEERHPDFPAISNAGIRVGHLAAITADSAGHVEVLNRAGFRLELEEPRWRWRDIVVDAEHRDRPVRLHGRDVTRIEFASTPERASAPSRRLHGTVHDRSGRSFTGFVDARAFNRGGRTYLDSHLLDDFEDEYRNYIPFDRIQSLERSGRGVSATLVTGEVLNLDDEESGPFRSPGPVRVSDPSLGMVEVEWQAFRSIRFHAPARPVGYGAFDGGYRLHGTVITRNGEEFSGHIRWDSDEEWSWERLDGFSEDVDFAIEFANILRIERAGEDGARVTVRDGRTFELTGSNDVGGDNKGIFVFLTGSGEAGAADPAGDPEWRYVAWEDFHAARFGHGEARRPGS